MRPASGPIIASIYWIVVTVQLMHSHKPQRAPGHFLYYAPSLRFVGAALCQPGLRLKVADVSAQCAKLGGGISLVMSAERDVSVALNKKVSSCR